MITASLIIGTVLIVIAALAVGAAMMACLSELTEQRRQTMALKRLAEALSMTVPPPLPTARLISDRN